MRVCVCVAQVRAEELPLQLAAGWVWYEPPADASSSSSPAAGGGARAEPAESFSTTEARVVESFSYFVSDSLQRSADGRVSIALAPTNDAPRPLRQALALRRTFALALALSFTLTRTLTRGGRSTKRSMCIPLA